MEESNDKQKFIKHFLAVAPKHCDNCGSKYIESDFKVIKSTPGGFVMHLRCQSCQNTYVLNVMNPGNGMYGTQRSPMNLDLESDSEIQAFAGKEAVSRNDALDAYNMMNSKLTEKAVRALLGLEHS